MSKLDLGEINTDGTFNVIWYAVACKVTDVLLRLDTAHESASDYPGRFLSILSWERRDVSPLAVAEEILAGTAKMSRASPSLLIQEEKTLYTKKGKSRSSLLLLAASLLIAILLLARDHLAKHDDTLTVANAKIPAQTPRQTGR